MNARNLLIGIGIVAVVTGGVLGSGALTTVTAERTATVNVADDNSAAISLSVADGLDSTIDGSGAGNTLDLQFENINRDATTTTTAFNVTNTLSEPVGLQVASSADWLTINNVNTSSGNYEKVKSDGTHTVQVTIDTTAGSFSSDSEDVDITVIAYTENSDNNP